MPNRFDIFMKRLALGERKESPRSAPVGDKQGAGRDQGDGGQAGRAKARAQEKGAERPDERDA